MFRTIFSVTPAAWIKGISSKHRANASTDHFEKNSGNTRSKFFICMRKCWKLANLLINGEFVGSKHSGNDNMADLVDTIELKFPALTFMNLLVAKMKKHLLL